MNIIEESFKEKEEKPKKRRKLLLIFLIIIIIAIISIIIALILMKEPERTAYVDGQPKNEIVEMIKDISLSSTTQKSNQTTNSKKDSTFYVPIKQISEYLGYAAYDGDYATKSEEKSKCYIENENEVVTLSLNLKRIYKIGKSQENDNYEYYDMKTPVKSFNGELYIQAEEMKNVFNAVLTYNEKANSINITTLNYLVQQNAGRVRDAGYETIDEEFVNQKAILDDMIVVKNKDKKSFAVIKASTGETILEPKYSGIKYLPTIGDFIVEDDEKYGVISAKRENKVAVNYDEIELIDKDAGLYVVKKDGRYGIIDLKGASKVPVEFDEIGIDTNKFKENNIKNKYLIVDNLIPIRKDNVWGLCDKKGNLVVGLEYDSFGYIATNNKNAMNLLVVPEYNVIVACKDGKYALINESGQALFAPVVDDIYMTYEGGKYNYIMNYNDETMNVEDYLKQTGVTRGDTTQTKQQQTQQTTEQESQQTEQENQQTTEGQ